MTNPQSFEKGIPLLEQVPARPADLDRIALQGAEVIADKITIEGNPSFPTAIRGSAIADSGTFVSFESITPEHAVMHMRAPGKVSTKKVAETGKGFHYSLSSDISVAEAKRLLAGLKPSE